VSWYQKGTANLDLTEARDSEWQWHQQVCTLLHTDNHTSTLPPSIKQTLKHTSVAISLPLSALMMTMIGKEEENQICKTCTRTASNFFFEGFGIGRLTPE